MTVHELLKYHRLKQNLTQEELATALFVSRQAVSKWERGEALPDIENIIALSDLYDISIDILLRGSRYLPKPYTIGEYNFNKHLFYGTITCLIFSFFMTLNTPIIFPIALLISEISTISLLKQGQWIIGKNKISIKYYPHFVDKVRSIFAHKRYAHNYKYEEICSIELRYIKMRRVSVYDFRPDYFMIQIKTKNNEIYTKEVDNHLYYDLPLFSDMLRKRGIDIIDEKNLIGVIASGQRIYDYVRDFKEEK